MANPQNPVETLVYAYWILVVQLLRSKIPWDIIKDLTEEEIHMVLGIVSAFDQKQSEDEQRAMASNR